MTCMINWKGKTIRVWKWYFHLTVKFRKRQLDKQSVARVWKKNVPALNSCLRHLAAVSVLEGIDMC